MVNDDPNEVVETKDDIPVVMPTADLEPEEEKLEQLEQELEKLVDDGNIQGGKVIEPTPSNVVNEGDECFAKLATEVASIRQDPEPISQTEDINSSQASLAVPSSKPDTQPNPPSIRQILLKMTSSKKNKCILLPDLTNLQMYLRDDLLNLRFKEFKKG